MKRSRCGRSWGLFTGYMTKILFLRFSAISHREAKKHVYAKKSLSKCCFKDVNFFTECRSHSKQKHRHIEMPPLPYRMYCLVYGDDLISTWRYKALRVHIFEATRKTPCSFLLIYTFIYSIIDGLLHI